MNTSNITFIGTPQFSSENNIPEDLMLSPQDYHQIRENLGRSYLDNLGFLIATGMEKSTAEKLLRTSEEQHLIPIRRQVRRSIDSHIIDDPAKIYTKGFRTKDKTYRLTEANGKTWELSFVDVREMEESDHFPYWSPGPQSAHNDHEVISDNERGIYYDPTTVVFNKLPTKREVGSKEEIVKPNNAKVNIPEANAVNKSKSIFSKIIHSIKLVVSKIKEFVLKIFCIIKGFFHKLIRVALDSLFKNKFNTKNIDNVDLNCYV